MSWFIQYLQKHDLKVSGRLIEIHIEKGWKWSLAQVLNFLVIFHMHFRFQVRQMKLEFPALLCPPSRWQDCRHVLQHWDYIALYQFCHIPKTQGLHFKRLHDSFEIFYQRFKRKAGKRENCQPSFWALACWLSVLRAPYTGQQRRRRCCLL